MEIINVNPKDLCSVIKTTFLYSAVPLLICKGPDFIDAMAPYFLAMVK